MIREGNVLLNVFIEKCVLNYVILQAVLSRYFTLSKALFFACHKICKNVENL